MPFRGPYSGLLPAAPHPMGQRAHKAKGMCAPESMQPLRKPTLGTQDTRNPAQRSPRVGHITICKCWQGDHACLARGTPDLCAMPFSVQNGANMGKQKGKSVPALSCRHVLSQNSEELQNSNLAHQTIIKAYMALSIVPFFLVAEIQPSPCSLSVSAQHIAAFPQTTFLSLPCS